MDLAKNLSTLIRSGIPLHESLALLSEETSSRRLRQALAKSTEAVASGTSLGSALGEEERTFGRLFIHLVKAGERSGTLEENLSFLAELLEELDDLRTKVRSALLYPEIVLVTAFLLTGALAVFVLPRLIPLFTNLGVALPLPTRLLLGTTAFIQTWWRWGLIGSVAFVLLITLLQRLPAVRRFSHWLALRLPFLGSLFREYQLALASRVFYTFSKSGLHLNELLYGGADAVTNATYRGALDAVAGHVETGLPLSEALARYPSLFPRHFTTIIAVGEKSGSLEGSFLNLATAYQKEVDARVKRLPTVLEPLLLISLGALVGFVAISIILPIYQITQGFRP